MKKSLQVISALCIIFMYLVFIGLFHALNTIWGPSNNIWNFESLKLSITVYSILVIIVFNIISLFKINGKMGYLILFIIQAIIVLIFSIFLVIDQPLRFVIPTVILAASLLYLPYYEYKMIKLNKVK